MRLDELNRTVLIIAWSEIKKNFDEKFSKSINLYLEINKTNIFQNANIFDFCDFRQF